jgi:site-specific DNA-methyltransferase (adenine-specific)
MEGKTRYNHAMSETVKLSTLIPDGKNANLGSPRGNQMIEDSLRQYGAGRSILLDKHGRIIAGNKTAENAGAIGMEDVLVVQSDGTRLVAVQRTDLDLDDPHTRQLAIADNRSSQVSLDWDTETLKGLVEDGVDLAPFWTADELAAMWPQTVDLLTDEDDVPPVPVEPVSKLGDLYILGDHRLLCGDSTVLADVERLMGGQKADMVFTDPPYNVDYEGNYIQSGQILKKEEKVWSGGIKNDNRSDFAGWLQSAYLVADQVMAEGCAIYIWHPSGAEGRHFWAGWLWDIWHFQVDLVWNKTSLIISRWDYKPQHEPCMYGWKGKNRTWTGPNNVATVWDIPRQQGRSGEERHHPTQKPVSLCDLAMANHSPAITLDLFGGSGSTLIACEKTGRRAFVMEIDPRYTDVIVARWEQATGKKAVLSAG